MATKSKKTSTKTASTKTASNTNAPVRAIKEKLTKSAIARAIAEQNDVPVRLVNQILSSLEAIIQGSVLPKAVGEFTWPGLFKVTLRKVPARPAGTLIRNPATGQMTPAAAKPASVRVKVRALAKLKTAAAA